MNSFVHDVLDFPNGFGHIFYFSSQYAKLCTEIQSVVLKNRIVSSSHTLRKKYYSEYDAKTGGKFS